MERDPLQQPSRRAPAESPQPQNGQEHAGFFEKWRKKKRRAEAEPQEKQPKTPEQAPTQEAPIPERRKFGKEILELIFSHKPDQQEPATSVETPENQPPSVTPESTPQYERAIRMRRFARVVIARVLGEAAEEPARARRRHEAEPIGTEPLVEAAHELRDAADDLNETAQEAQEAPADNRPVAAAGVEQRGDGGYETFDPLERYVRMTTNLEHTVSERIDDRLRQLEESAEISRRASVAAVGLGVIAVIMTGTEYFSRKRTEKDIRHDTNELKREVKNQERVMEQQQVMFDRLRDTQVNDMERDRRQEYYERLSAFTHQQTERTREVNQELRRVVERAAPVAEKPEVAPIVRVENADTIERAPGRQMGNAGADFFGGGIVEGAGSSDSNSPRAMLDPNSPEARKLEELRKIEQARLQQNAWFYGATLIVTMVGAVVAAIFLG